MDWRLFGSTFSLIFLAELPGKTALATLFLATRGRPAAIFVGVALAFAVQSVIAVTAGSLFGALPAQWVRLGSGLVFLVFGLLFLKESLSSEEEGTEEAADEGRSQPEGQTSLSQASRAFVVIFVAEWGDLTQLATVSLQARHQRPWVILGAATLALWSVTALVVTAGHRARHWIKPRPLQRLAAAAFLLAGAWMVVSWLVGH